jgi:hypothetical protein
MLWIVFSECFLVSPSPFSLLPLAAIHHCCGICHCFLSSSQYQFLSSVLRRHPLSRKEPWCTQCPTLRSSSAPQMTSGAPVNMLTISCPISCLTSSLRVCFFKDMVNLAASASSSWALVSHSSHYFACGLSCFNSRNLKSSCNMCNSVSYKKNSLLKFGVIWLHHKHCWFAQYALQLQDL